MEVLVVVSEQTVRHDKCNIKMFRKTKNIHKQKWKIG